MKQPHVLPLITVAFLFFLLLFPRENKQHVLDLPLPTKTLITANWTRSVGIPEFPENLCQEKGEP